MPKVSVLMPVFNSGEFLTESIDSVINQSFTDWELIVVNDGSTDNSEAIINSYNDKRIRYHNNGENRGLIFTRRLMIDMALGEYIAFLDSDDVALPNRLKTQIDFLDKNVRYGMCGSWGVQIDEKGKKGKVLKIATEAAEIRCSLLFSNTFIQSSVVIRKKLFGDETYNPGFTVAEDYDLWCRLSVKHKLKNIPTPLIKYRWHQNNISKEKEKLADTLVKSVMKRELVNLGIYATDEEINLHAALRDVKAIDISRREYFRLLRPWLRKLVGANQLCRAYDYDTFLAVTCFRWIYGCKIWKSYHNIFLLPVALNWKAFLKLSRMIWQRML
ncbi:glycosyltransferase [Dysgonomonas sp. 216]|uniref:glycosyltransferase family 2 protein n=1 Tax=Dysgonomonas sp. 216 TaxID=2302934 RepID=UPI002107BC35|nr:glycosyltransferase [Dysgonomonas sp. 216]NDW17733.1 glycosyltransferase [Dysgonomonas sp. 216]